MHPSCAAVFFAEQLHVQLRWIASALGFIVRCIRGGLASLPYLGFLASEEPESVKRTVLATRPRPTFLDLTVICRTRLNIPPGLTLQDGPEARVSEILRLLSPCIATRPPPTVFSSDPRPNSGDARRISGDLRTIGRGARY